MCPRVGPGCVLCTRIDPLRFLAGCRRRRLNQGLVVALGFFSRCWIGHVFVLFFSVYGCMLCLVRYLFVISTSVIYCLGRFVPEMTYCVLSGMLNLTKLKLNSNCHSVRAKVTVSSRSSKSYAIFSYVLTMSCAVRAICLASRTRFV